MSAQREVKRFVTTDREEVPFEIDGTKYVVVPASGLATRRYREASLAQAEMEVVGEEGADQRHVFRKMQGMAGSQTRLVADCTYRLLSDGGREGPMEQRFVEDKFPGDCIEWAYAEIKRISPWVEEKGDGNDVGRLEKQRAALDERIARLKAADPKGAPPPSTTSSIARGG